MLSRLCSVITDGELPGLSLYCMQGQRKWSQAETLPVAHGKNSDSITLSQKSSSLNLAILFSNYGSLKLLVADFALPFKAMT